MPLEFDAADRDTGGVRLGIVGGGRAAWAFASTWKRAGNEISGLMLRSGSASETATRLSARTLAPDQLVSESDVILFAVRDDQLRAVVEDIAPLTPDDLPLFHASGSLASDIFGPHSARFSLHPLRALPAVGENADLTDALFVFEGAPSMLPIARRIADAARARLVTIDRSQKVLYHAAAVFASNYAVTILEQAAATLALAGVDPDLFRRDLASLAQSAIDNWLAQKDERRFTGPIVRGDVDVVTSHVDALYQHGGDAELYRILALRLATIILHTRPDRADLQDLIFSLE
jgi:predicted short-subunit dehydrogenase-like oxidoreductase (DUF2520 family)